MTTNTSKNSWTEKLHSAKPHEMIKAPMAMAGAKKGDIMLVPSPQIVDDFIRAIPEGVGVDVTALRDKLAEKYGAQTTCPITIGIQLRTVAEAAYEALGQGAPLENITPFWRVLDEHAPTTRKLSCGADFVARRRMSEGVTPPPSSTSEKDSSGITAFRERSLWA